MPFCYLCGLNYLLFLSELQHSRTPLIPLKMGQRVDAMWPRHFKECHRYADAANWKEFTYSMGGPVCPRDARPVRLHHLLDPAKNKYGEDVIRLVSVATGMTIKATRLDD